MHVRIAAHHLQPVEVFDPSIEAMPGGTDRRPMSIVWGIGPLPAGELTLTGDIGPAPAGELTLTGDPAALELLLRKALRALGNAQNRRRELRDAVEAAFIDTTRTIGDGVARKRDS